MSDLDMVSNTPTGLQACGYEANGIVALCFIVALILELALFSGVMWSWNKSEECYTREAQVAARFLSVWLVILMVAVPIFAYIVAGELTAGSCS